MNKIFQELNEIRQELEMGWFKFIWEINKGIIWFVLKIVFYIIMGLVIFSAVFYYFSSNVFFGGGF